MKIRFVFTWLLFLILFLASAALASNTWYVNGVTGSDSNNCKSATTACKTIGHAISLASSGDTIEVAAATYKENLTIDKSLNMIGAGLSSTVINGGAVASVVAITNATAHVSLFNFTIRNGLGGVSNKGILTINNSTISFNHVRAACHYCGGVGGGIENSGNLTVNNSTITGNSASGEFGAGIGGGIGVALGGVTSVNNSTIVGNSVPSSGGGGIGILQGSITIQNSIVANNSPGNCRGGNSKGYNLSSDDTCNFNGPGDLNNSDPKLGPLQNNGGPTQTMALLPGSPAIDAGNPSGCTDGNGNLLKTDQRGKPRPDKEDTGGCDIGAFEKQSD